MATRALGAESARVITPVQFPPAAAARLATRMLSRFDRARLGDAIEVMVELFDALDGDPDREITSAEDDFIDPISRGRRYHGPGCNVSDAGEYAGDELDGTAAEDELTMGLARFSKSPGPGCVVSDPDTGVDDEGEGIDEREPDEDTEIEQMQHDVPMLSVYSLDLDQETGERAYLGRSNLMTSFRGQARSADTGAFLIFRNEEPILIGTPL